MVYLLTPSTNKKNDDKGGSMYIIDISNMKTKLDIKYNTANAKKEPSHIFFRVTIKKIINLYLFMFMFIYVT